MWLLTRTELKSGSKSPTGRLGTKWNLFTGSQGTCLQKIRRDKLRNPDLTWQVRSPRENPVHRTNWNSYPRGGGICGPELAGHRQRIWVKLRKEDSCNQGNLHAPEHTEGQGWQENILSRSIHWHLPLSDKLAFLELQKWMGRRWALLWENHR